jgi:hypothetical protein
MSSRRKRKKSFVLLSRQKNEQRLLEEIRLQEQELQQKLNRIQEMLRKCSSQD